MVECVLNVREAKSWSYFFINDYFIIHFSTVIQKRIFFFSTGPRGRLPRELFCFMVEVGTIRLVKDDKIKRAGDTYKLLPPRG